MTNNDFMNTVTNSFEVFLNTGSRSNEKLKILHGDIANDLQSRLGREYSIASLGYREGKEAEIRGRYIDKKVDITISKQGQALAGIGVKFVMQNYQQNSNNYFENMLGETANIRSNRVAYFQIFIVPDKMPYYKSNGDFEKWEELSQHNVAKYITLSNDDINVTLHTPNKTLLYVVHLPEIHKTIANKREYIVESQTCCEVRESDCEYGYFNNAVIYNDYETFIDKVVHYVLSI